MISRTVLQTDFNALAHNVDVYKSFLNPSTKLCAVIKASGYGSSDVKLAEFYEERGVDFLAVAYTDEGIKLRKHGISSSILVFNPEINCFDDLIKYNLQPTFYDFSQFKKLEEYKNTNFKIHIKLDSGMHRLGFEKNQIDKLIGKITENRTIEVASVFSHLAASEDRHKNEFTNNQIKLFSQLYNKIQSKLSYKPLKHILNSAGIIHFPKAQFDMVRLGIGMHSDDISNTINDKLKAVHTLKTKIIQIKTILPNEGIGYGIGYIKNYTRRIAIIPLGYADGIFRLLGNGNYKVWIKGSFAPIVGNVSMDTCFIDITDLKNIKLGDSVEIFGKNAKIQNCASAANTISYEVLSRISPRVQRVFVK